MNVGVSAGEVRRWVAKQDRYFILWMGLDNGIENSAPNITRSASAMLQLSISRRPIGRRTYMNNFGAIVKSCQSESRKVEKRDSQKPLDSS
jgi:hypothetical protein